MHEVELKLQVPAACRSAVDAEVAGRHAAQRQRLQAAYFDTADRALARAGMALRVRREGRRWMQTLKADAVDGMTRFEHNVGLPATTSTDTFADPQLHAGTPAGDRLLEVLRGAPSPALQCLYRTDIRRRSRRVRTAHGTLELAFDEGEIVAGPRRLPVCELEIELLAGSPQAVIAAARRWVLRHRLWLDTRSKAARGDLLARGETMTPPCKAAAVELMREMSLAEGRRAVLGSCLQQIVANGSQVASGTFEDEHVHQLRIGLRRMRTALRVFPAEATPAALPLEAAVLFRRLGAARDRAAVAAPLAVALSEALAAAGLGFEAPAMPAPDDAADPAELMRLGPAQALLLELFAQTRQAAESAADDAPELRAALAHRIGRWHHKVRADAKRFHELDDVGRHTLRKRAKTLRYAIEFAASLFKPRAVERYLKPLRKLQECLGEIVDVMVALDAYRNRSSEDPHALFALGWLAGRKQELIARGDKPVRRFLKAEAFW
ncbi:CYTH and CHAD domain-containing protein [Piscinibacter sp. XHJ-5]|uniref:CYTH and CHAD domain-containing protein n=1 Tax=Piscinibacter sp. XHJ-5 TaxID=3037797 RepID=UPI0024534AC7|nr:CYTH and CHAD domain-containing protein [Piscinibacter sp. XHJ-5]